MGWSSGSELAGNIWGLISNYIPEDKKKEVAKDLIQLFEYRDCDTLHECRDLMLDAGYDGVIE